MEREFIPYKEALALKELGFDEPCLYGYDTFGVLISSSARWENWNKSLQLVSAPLFQQAFRWFRENKGLVPHIELDSECPLEVEYSFHIIILEGNNIFVSKDHYFPYEEAELACLQKLVEIAQEL